MQVFVLGFTLPSAFDFGLLWLHNFAQNPIEIPIVIHNDYTLTGIMSSDINNSSITSELYIKHNNYVWIFDNFYSKLFYVKSIVCRIRMEVFRQEQEIHSYRVSSEATKLEMSIKYLQEKILRKCFNYENINAEWPLLKDKNVLFVKKH